jgi:rod shape-determining protein MreB
LKLLSSLAPLLYVQISPERLTIRNAKTGEQVAEPAQIAIERGARAKVLAAGANAATVTGPAVEIVHPFAHPRSLVSDFAAGEQLLKALVNRISSGSVLRAAPRLMVHLLGDPEGGFTQVEARAFHEMALGAGASQAVVWAGRPLTDQELLSGEFTADGKVLS